MKLGTETGSFFNHLYSRMTKGAPAPEVGMGATILHWTDRTAGTVTAVDRKTGVVTITEDDTKVVSGSAQDGSAVYSHSPDPNGCRHHFKLDRAGAWRETRKNENGRWILCRGNGLILGMRQHYYDPSF